MSGTYRISAYKRPDGTEVSSYMRTCGAKHVGVVAEVGDKLYNELTEKEKIMFTIYNK